MRMNEMKGTTTIDLDEYCDGCAQIELETKIDPIYPNNAIYSNEGAVAHKVKITCSNRQKCHDIFKHILTKMEAKGDI